VPARERQFNIGIEPGPADATDIAEIALPRRVERRLQKFDVV
jgi:hypothetical protein